MSIEGNREYRRAAAKYMQEQNVRYPAHLVEVPRDEWPEYVPPGLLTAYRSKTYLVQVFNEGKDGVLVRLSVIRTGITPKGGWLQDIPWEDLQRLKREAGYADFDAVEVYPQDGDVVNVANIRHLWVMAHPLRFKWSGVRQWLNHPPLSCRNCRPRRSASRINTASRSTMSACSPPIRCRHTPPLLS